MIYEIPESEYFKITTLTLTLKKSFFEKSQFKVTRLGNF